MICIKANDLPHQSIKLATASGEERKRDHQDVIVRDAWSHKEHQELRHWKKALKERVGTDGSVDAA